MTDTHQQAREALNRSLERPLHADERNALEAHLAECPGCAAYREQLQALDSRLRLTLPKRSAARSFTRLDPTQVERSIRRKKTMNRVSVYARQAGGLAAAALLIFGIVWAVSNLRPKTPAQQQPVEDATPTVAESVPSFNDPTATTEAPVETPNASPEAPVKLSDLSVSFTFHDPTGRWDAIITTEGKLYLSAAGGDRLIEVPDLPVVSPADINAPWSPDGAWLAVFSLQGVDAPQQTALWIIPINDAGPGEKRAVVELNREEVPGPANDSMVSSFGWSPDNSRLVYALNGETWVYEPAAAKSQAVTNLAAYPLARPQGSEKYDEVVRAYWSPDGEYLALDLDGNFPSPYAGVGLVDLQGGAPRLLVDGARPLGWSPDGKVLLTNVTGDYAIGYTYDFYTYDIRDDTLTNLTRSNPELDPLVDGWENYVPAPYEAWGIVWGPGTQYIVLTRHFLNGEYPPALGFIVHDGPETVLAERFGTTDGEYVFPAWLPNGQVGYLEVEPARPNPDNADLYQLRQVVVAGQPVADIPAGLYFSNAVWSPDSWQLTLLTTDDPTHLPEKVQTFSLSQ